MTPGNFRAKEKGDAPQCDSLSMVIRYISMKFQPSVLYGSIFSIAVIFFTRIADLINMDSQCIKNRTIVS